MRDRNRKYYGVSVDKYVDLWTTYSAPEDAEWDRDSTDGQVTVYGIRRSDVYPDIMTTFEPIVGKVYHLIWAQYSTGDSFGTDGGQYEFIDLFESEEAAKDLVSYLENIEDVNFDGNYIQEDGTEVRFYPPWIGYFEHLDFVKYQSLVLQSSET